MFDSDMDKYFDFEAASSDPWASSHLFQSGLNCGLFRIVDKGHDSLQPSISMEDLELELQIMALQQAFDHNPYQVDMGVDDMHYTAAWGTEFFEPPTSTPARKSPQFNFEWLDSESSSSASSSPCSLFSTLSSSHSPISCELEADSDGFLEDDGINLSGIPCVQVEHGSFATFYSPPAPCSELSLPPSKFVHAPPPGVPAE
ncbi:hypothetical protein MSAN_00323700 [Mycena sanguinolenta]|uniref:Uncharacterized protein n=1 Tax=Mycena sanguinolenta TaxID=230812 RepID=A0A8H7DIF2_9AGAR|nr:hypothetical protein MSAN_00323700 [Mycena sanguinolenta]